MFRSGATITMRRPSKRAHVSEKGPYPFFVLVPANKGYGPFSGLLTRLLMKLGQRLSLAAVALVCLPALALGSPQRQPGPRNRAEIRREIRETMREAFRVYSRARSEVRQALAEERRAVREMIRRELREVARERRRAAREARRRWW